MRAHTLSTDAQGTEIPWEPQRRIWDLNSTMQMQDRFPLPSICSLYYNIGRFNGQKKKNGNQSLISYNTIASRPKKSVVKSFLASFASF